MLNTVTTINSAIRTMFIVFDAGVYWLLRFSYMLLFNIMTFNIIDRKMVFDIVSRVQLVIGIFMLFQLVMIIIKGIVNPDTVSDSKSGGAGNIIMRIVVSLALLALIVPINISSPKNEYEKQINNNGILFGTLYSLQYRVLSNNTLGKIIIGKDSVNYTSSDSSSNLSDFADEFVLILVKTFYTLNTQTVNGKEVYVCGDGFDEVYEKTDDPFTLLALATRSCGSSGTIGAVADNTMFGTFVNTGKSYSMSMSYFLSTLCAGVLAILMFLIILDVAKRVFQLVALQLIAPIPIISYMDPKGSKDGAFASWVKLLGTTYADLFVRLGVIYFAIEVLRTYSGTFGLDKMGFTRLDSGDLVMSSPGIMKWTYIIMAIALFIFVKEAPKFFRQMLGIKSDKKFFDSFGQALGIGAIGAGVVSGAVAGAVSKYQNTDGEKGKKVAAGIFGGIGGGFGSGVNAGRAYFSSKDGNFQGIMDGNRKYAQQLYTNAADASTFGGRFVAGLQSNIGLQNDLQKMDDMIKYYTAAKDAMGRMNDAFNSNGDHKFGYKGAARRDAQGNVMKDANGNILYDGKDLLDQNNNVVLKAGKNYSLKDYNDILSHVQASGDQRLIDAVDSAKKLAQSNRLTDIRLEFNEKDRTVARKRLIAEIERCANLAETDADYHKWTQRDLDVFDGAYSIFNVAKKYDSEPIFAQFKGKDFNSSDLSWAVFKTAASAAGDTGKSMKASPEYDRASANAKRAQEANKKK